MRSPPGATPCLRYAALPLLARRQSVPHRSAPGLPGNPVAIRANVGSPVGMDVADPVLRMDCKATASGTGAGCGENPQYCLRNSGGATCRPVDCQRASERGCCLRFLRQVPEHAFAGLLGRSECLERRPDDLHGAPVLIEWAPRCQKSRMTVKARTAAALITDHKRNTIAACIPYLHIIDVANDATELHAAPRRGAPRKKDMHSPSRKMQAS